MQQQQRLDAMKISPAAYKAMAGLQAYVDQSGLARSLRELVKIRASQIKDAPIASSCAQTSAQTRGKRRTDALAQRLA